MTYATLDQLTERYGEGMLVLLTDRGEVTTGLIDTGVVEDELARTDGLINSFLRGRYVVPLAEVPDPLPDIALAVTIWKLHRQSPDQKIKDDYDYAMKLLERLSKGEMKLDVAGVEPPTVKTTGVRLTDRERPLTEDNMKGFI